MLRAMLIAMFTAPVALNGAMAQNGAPIQEPLSYSNAVYGTSPVVTPGSAALYPSPVPHVPVEVGGSMITNQALAPHEMLYPHRYRALYGPFYYRKVLWFPSLYRSEVARTNIYGETTYRRRWRLAPATKLVGTEVKVNYRGSISPFSGFLPPL